MYVLQWNMRYDGGGRIQVCGRESIDQDRTTSLAPLNQFGLFSSAWLEVFWAGSTAILPSTLSPWRPGPKGEEKKKSEPGTHTGTPRTAMLVARFPRLAGRDGI